MLVPFTVNGLGVREAFFVSFLGNLGVSADAAFACGFLFFVMTILLALPGLAVILWEQVFGRPPRDRRARCPSAVADVTVVVVTWNALPWIEQCLASVHGRDVIVVDNGSTDGTVDLVREQLPARARDRAGEPRHGRRQQHRHARGRRPLLLPAQLRRLGRRRRARQARRSSPTRIPKRPSSARGCCNTDGTLQRSVRGEPTLWRLATEYLFIRKLAPRSRRLNPLYAGGFDHDEVAEADWLFGPALLVRREAADAVGLFDEDFFMFSEEVDWMTRFRRAGWKVLFFPGAEVVHVGGASHGGTHVRREPARAPALVRQASRPAARPSACAGCCCSSLRLRAARAPPRRVSRGRALPLVRRRTDAAQEVIVYLRLAFGTLVRPRSRLGRRARARAAQRLGRARVDDGERLRRVGRRLHAAPLDPPRGRRAGRDLRSARWSRIATSRTGSRSEPRSRVVAGRRRRARLGRSGTSRASSPATALFHEARVRKLVDLTSCTCARSTSSRTAGCIPGYAFPLWHGCSRSSRGSRASTRGWSCGTSRRCSRRSRSRSTWEAGVAVFGSRWAGSSLVVSSLAVFCFGPGHGGSYATLALPGDRGAAAARAGGDRALLLASHGAGARSRPSSARSRSRIRPTRSSCSCRCGVHAAACAGVADVAPLLAAALVPTALVLLWLRPIVNETVSHDPGAGRARCAGCSTTATSSWSATSTTSGSRRRSSAAAARSPSPRCSCCRSRRSRCRAAGRCSRSRGTLVDAAADGACRGSSSTSPTRSRSRSRAASPASRRCSFALVGALALLARSSARAARGARRRHRAAAALAGRLRVRPAPRRPGCGDLDRARRRRDRARRRVASGDPTCASTTRSARPRPPASCCRCSSTASGTGARACRSDPLRALAAARAPPAHRRAEGRGRARARQDELPGRGRRRRSTSSRAPVTHVANTKANDPYDARARRSRHWVLTNDPRVARRYGATWAIRSGRLYRLPR